MSSRQGGFGQVGVILATAGSAVGLGNIWKFPYVLGQNGGAAWLLVYLVCVLLFGIPIMIAETYIGKRSHSTMYDAFRKLSKNNRWQWVSWLCVLCPIALLGFYLVVTGWCLEYLYLSILGHFNGMNPVEIESGFGQFVSHPAAPIFWTIIALAISVGIELGGVKGGIERTSKMLMPMLLIILIIMIGRSLMMDGSTRGVRFLLEPRWEQFSTQSILSAMGQCFYSLSVGMGILIAYSAYMQPTQNLPKTCAQVATIDTLVATLAGMAIFPAVFALGINPQEGPQLVFVTLPSVFSQMSAGYMFSTLFFLLMSIAAITSAVSMIEVQVSWLKGLTGGWSRNKRMLVIVPILGLLSVGCAWSMSDAGEWIRPCGQTWFDILDIFTSKLLIPLCALMSSIFVGWRCSRADFYHEMKEHGELPTWLTAVIRFILRYVAPLAIVVIFLDGFGFFSH